MPTELLRADLPREPGYVLSALVLVERGPRSWATYIQDREYAQENPGSTGYDQGHYFDADTDAQAEAKYQEALKDFGDRLQLYLNHYQKALDRLTKETRSLRHKNLEAVEKIRDLEKALAAQDKEREYKAVIDGLVEEE